MKGLRLFPLFGLILLLILAVPAQAQLAAQITFDKSSVDAGTPISASWAIAGASPQAEISCWWSVDEDGMGVVYDADATQQPAVFTPVSGRSGSFNVVVSEPSGSTQRFTEHFVITKGGATMVISMQLDKESVVAGMPITATWQVSGGVPPYRFETGWETDEENAGFSVQPFRATRQESSEYSATAWPQIGDIGRFYVEVYDKNGQSKSAEAYYAITGGLLLSKKVAQIITQCKAQASGDYSRAKWLFDYLQKIPDAGGTTLLHSSPHCILLLGNGLCESYATAYKLLCSQVGVNSMFVGGTAGGAGHAWTLVKIGEHWYHADPTWGWDYFLLSDEEMAKDHSWDTSQYPACPVAYGQGLLGDANGDGRVDLDDLTSMVHFLVAQLPLASPQNADTTGNGVVEINDMLFMIDVIINR